MNLNTTYLGLKLKNPLIAASSPLSQQLDNLRRMEDAGLGAIVMHSLFEEQIIGENRELFHHMTHGTESFAEALTYFPEPEEFVLGPDEYLNHIRRAKQMVQIPIIGSLNGFSLGGWTKYAKLMQDAGADALELNIYYVPTSVDVPGTEVEKTYIDILKTVKSSVTIPVSIKLSPFFSGLAHFGKQLELAGADGLVLFNRFYQPDIDLDNLEVVRSVILSTAMAMRLPLRWIAILYKKLHLDLAAVSGVHQATDVLKMMMVGANATMLCSTLYKNRVIHAKKILEDMRIWMEEREYDSIEQMRGSMSQKSCEDPDSFERAQYVRAIKSDMGIKTQ